MRDKCGRRFAILVVHGVKLTDDNSLSIYELSGPAIPALQSGHPLGDRLELTAQARTRRGGGFRGPFLS